MMVQIAEQAPGTGRRTDRASRAPRTAPERRCVVTGESGPREGLLRFVVGPGDEVVPDLEARLPGRGFWLTAHRDMVEAARRKGAFSRAARRPVRVADDLSDRVSDLLARRCLQLLGLARRSGAAASGFEGVRDWLNRDRVAILFTACDGAAGSVKKIRALTVRARVRPHPVGLFASGELGRVFGKGVTVHAAVAPGGLADRLICETRRLEGFRPADGTEAA